MLLVILLCSAVLRVGSTALEEVLEHGPLFDELEDEAWWSGVDIVDTALRSSSYETEVIPTGASDLMEEVVVDFCQLMDAAACSMVVDLRLPPPPPVPPSLTDLVKQLNQLGSAGPTGGDGQQCLLCQWASLNGTSIEDLIPNSELSSENTWVPMLVVVALVSAMLGAVLMITALKCRRLKVLPRGGSCPTLPVGYMLGEGKEQHQGVVQATELIETLPKMRTVASSANASNSELAAAHHLASLNRPRLNTPTCADEGSILSSHHHEYNIKSQPTGWRVKLWRKMTGKKGGEEDRQLAVMLDQSDAISAVYAELNSVAGSSVHHHHHHHPPSIYHLNTYSEIRDHPRILPPPAAPGATGLHLRRLLSDGTYENAGYALERGVILIEHDAVSSGCSASTPSSAYYSDLSDRSGSQHQQQWAVVQQHLMRQRVGSESGHSSHSCCGHHHHSRSLHARDLMPVTLQVIPDNQQYPSSCAETNGLSSPFCRGGVSASLNGGSTKRPLPPLPSRQQQRPQRRYAYAVDQQVVDGGGLVDCVPSEYV